jgi:hypothetical protein
LPNLVIAVDNLAQALINEINAGHVADVQQARNAAEEIYYTYYIDLYHFAEKIPLYVPSATAQAQAVMHEVSWSMYEAHGTSVPNDHGLSIYFPRVEGDYLLSYDNTAFASDTQWNEFLKSTIMCQNQFYALILTRHRMASAAFLKGRQEIGLSI